MVENNIYCLKLYPNGGGIGEDTHISVYTKRTHLPSLESNQSNKVTYSFTMLHSSDPLKNYQKNEKTDDYGSRHEYAWGYPKF